MGKLTKQQLKQHEIAEDLLWGSDKPLKRDAVAFCLEHWDPRALSGQHVAKNQAYFTPLSLALDACAYVGGDGRRVVDIGAGIGRLSYAVLCANLWNPRQVRLTAVELNPDYLRVGRRLLPQVEWVEGDFYDQGLWQRLPPFAEAVSNPPFGRVVTECALDWIGYRGTAGLTVATMGLKVAELGITIILPQTQTPYAFSGRRSGENVYRRHHSRHLKAFLQQHPQLEWHHSSIDTEQPSYKGGWRGVSPLVEATSLYDPNAHLISRPKPPIVPKPSYSLAQLA